MNVPSQPCDNIQQQQQQDSGSSVRDCLNQYTDGLFPNSGVKTPIYGTKQHASPEQAGPAQTCATRRKLIKCVRKVCLWSTIRKLERKGGAHVAKLVIIWELQHEALMQGAGSCNH